MEPLSPSQPHGFICLAVYRPDPEMFRRQLVSLKRQSLAAFRCLVGADGDPAGIRRLVIEAVGDDDRFEVVGFDRRVGFYRNFERLVALVPSSSDWFALADQDDEWHEDKLARLVPLLSSAAVVSCQGNVVPPEGGPVSQTTRRRSSFLGLVAENQITGSFSVFRRDLLELALPFPEPTAAAFHDHWLAVCGHLRGGVGVSPLVLQEYVQHEAQVQGEDRPSALAAWKRLRQPVAGEVAAPGVVHRLVHDRFEWRRRMCVELLRRSPGPPSRLPRELQLVARPQPLRLALSLAGCVKRREVPAHRAAAMAFSSLVVRLTSLAGGH
jgi:hypothetical protein